MPEIVRFARVVDEEGLRWARVQDGRALFLDGAPWLGGRPSGQGVSLEELGLDCPVAPSKVFAVGKNYRAHAAEMGGPVPAEPLIFAKAISSLLGPDKTVLLPRESTRIDYEGELGVVIGKRCRRVPPQRAMDHVFGLVPVCDVTARDLQARDGQWTRAKSFDTFCPTGPFVVTGVEPADLELSLRIGGKERQRARTSEMVFDVAHVVAYVSSFATLEPGDLILTGTPEGVGPLTAGDRVEVAIENVGSLFFGVADEE